MSFEIAVKQAAVPDEWIEFTVGDQICKAVAYPSGGQIAYITIQMHKARNEAQQMTAILNFLDSLLDEETAQYLLDLLVDRTNDFEVPALVEICNNLIAEWSGNPTGSASDSSDSPPTTGDPSTTPPPESTSLVSPFIAS